MDLILQNIIIVWLGIGALFVLLEALAIPGVGFLFLGLAAITTGGLIQFNAIAEDKHLIQMISFLGTTFLWTIILWLPLQNFLKKNKKHDYSNIVGDVATIYKSPLTKGKKGQVKWSGTIMYAVLAENSPLDNLPEGEDVIIIKVTGNLLEVKPK